MITINWTIRGISMAFDMKEPLDWSDYVTNPTDVSHGHIFPMFHNYLESFRKKIQGLSSGKEPDE